MLAGLYTVTKSVTNYADVWGVQGSCHQICNQIEGNGGQWNQRLWAIQGSSALSVQG